MGKPARSLCAVTTTVQSSLFFPPRYQTPFGNAMRREIAFPTAGVSAGRSRRQARPQTPHPHETEFRPQGRAQTEFGNGRKVAVFAQQPSRTWVARDKEGFS